MHVSLHFIVWPNFAAGRRNKLTRLFLRPTYALWSSKAQNYAVTNPQGWLNGDFPVKDTGALDVRAIGIVESGGKHFNADGGVITSPAGAQGKYQLMPDLGKELAAKRGLNTTRQMKNKMPCWRAITQISCTVNMALKRWRVLHITGVWETLTS